MKYVKASHVLPQNLICEIQKYIQGATIYIPKQPDSYQKWGDRSGARKLLDKRNISIKEKYQNGATIEQLADEYYLAIETIKKIVYAH